MARSGLLVLSLGAAVSRGAELHWSTNGVHMGVLSRKVEPSAASGLDPLGIPGGHNFIGSFSLSYALWTLAGEPMHEFIFTWDWRGTNMLLGQSAGHTWTTADLRKYPDLRRAFFALKPAVLSLETTIQFYDGAGKLFAVGRNPVHPWPLAEGGAQDRLHSPGSPPWADFFTCGPAGTASREELGRRNRALFERAARVELTAPRITEALWPEHRLRSILDQLVQREGLGQKPNATGLAGQPTPAAPTNPPPGKPLAVSASPPAHRLPAMVLTSRPRLNPLELARQGVGRGSENPLERAARLQSGDKSVGPAPVEATGPGGGR